MEGWLVVGLIGEAAPSGRAAGQRGVRGMDFFQSSSLRVGLDAYVLGIEA